MSRSNAAVSVGFSVDGQAIAEHVRLKVLSKDWRGALTYLLGAHPAFTFDVAIDVLTGIRDIEGSSDLDSLAIVRANPLSPDIQRYLNTLRFQTAGLYMADDGTVYQPEYRIDVLGEHDYKMLAERAEESDWYEDEFLKERIKFYGRQGYSTFVTFPEDQPNTRVIDFRSAEAPEDMAVIWKQISDYPLWVTPSKCPYEALTDYLEVRQLDGTGHWHEGERNAYLVYLLGKRTLTLDESDQRDQLLEIEYQEQLVKLRAEIVEQAGPTEGEGWLRLPVFANPEKEDGYDPTQRNTPERFVLVPKLAFYHWSLGRIPSVALGLHEHWKSVSPMGMKMMNDDVYHSDWVIGAGFDPRTFYNDHKTVDASANVHRLRIAQEKANFDFVPLTKTDKSYISGKVKLLKPGEELEKGQIGVCDTAGVEYHNALVSAAKHGGALICKTGGRLAHLATVGREMNVPIIMWDKAGLLNQFHDVSIDFNSGKISFIQTF